MQSRISSLSMRGILKVDAKERARVDFPVPGCPFIAIITGFGGVIIDSSFAMDMDEIWYWRSMDENEFLTFNIYSILHI